MAVRKEIYIETGQPKMAQFEATGKPFKIVLDEKLEKLTAQERVVRIVGVLDETTGEIVYTNLDNIPSHIHPDQLPHISLDEADALIDLANEGSPRKTTVLKHGASTSGVDMSEIYRSRGGDNKSTKKTGGFRFKK